MEIDTNYLWREQKKLLTFAFLAVSILLIIMMFFKILNFFRMSSHATTIISSAIEQIGVQNTDIEQYLIDDRQIVSNLSQNNIFFQEESPVNPVTEVRGIFYDSALINNNWYSVGDNVGQATIVAIEPAQVTVEWNGQTFTYSPLDASFEPIQDRGGRGGGRGTLPMAANLIEASQNIGATAVSSGGGARITSSTSGRTARWGFQEGDIVLSINGMNVNTGDGLTEVMNNISTGSAVEAQIIRNGRQMTVGRDEITSFTGGTGQAARGAGRGRGG